MQENPFAGHILSTLEFLSEGLYLTEKMLSFEITNRKYLLANRKCPIGKYQNKKKSTWRNN
jgi:hypothetical protein